MENLNLTLIINPCQERMHTDILEETKKDEGWAMHEATDLKNY